MPKILIEIDTNTQAVVPRVPTDAMISEAEIWTAAREYGMSFSDAQQIADDLCRELPVLDCRAGSVDPICPVVEIRNTGSGVQIHCAQ